MAWALASTFPTSVSTGGRRNRVLPGGESLSIAKRYQQSGNANKLLTQQVALGLDGRKHRRNLNVLICGGSGAGKTRFYAKPNIMQANTSFVILDPKGELLQDTGHLLEEKGYVIINPG